MSSGPIHRMLHPERVAVIGASSRRHDAGGNQTLRNLRASGFTGAIEVVNPAGGSIEGLRAVQSVSELTVPDVAFLALPAARVLTALQELAEVGCNAAVVPSTGMSAAGEVAVQELARKTSMLIHGTNCMGFVNATAGVALWLDEGTLIDVPRGDIALIAQSGSAAIFVTRSAAPHGFSKIISTGNEVTTTAAHYIDHLADDPATRVIGVVLESIHDAAHFASAVRRARKADKPVVVLKVGRTAGGARATTAHTGAVLASSDAYDALFASLDVPTVKDYDELATTLQCLSDLGGRRISGNRLGILTISGGQAAMAADLAEDLEVRLPAFSALTHDALAAAMPDIAINNPLDAGGSLAADEDGYADALEIMARDPELDAVLVLLDGQSTLNDAEIAYEDDYYIAARKVAERSDRLPVLVASSSSVSIHQHVRDLLGGGVPLLRGARNALVAARAASANGPLGPRAERPADLPRQQVVEDLRSAVRASGRTVEPELTHRLLTAYGLAFAARCQVPDAGAAAAWADEQGYPVVLKIDSPDIAHRSDVGGVVVGITDRPALLEAARSIAAAVAARAPGARITGFEVQEQVVGAVEGFAGYVGDPRLGPSLAVGTGGVLVELTGDTVTMTCPVTPDTAAGLIATTTLATVLRGYRDLIPATPLDGLADLTSRLSWLASDLGDDVVEVDLNPVLIEPGTGRVRLVDALLVNGCART